MNNYNQINYNKIKKKNYNIKNLWILIKYQAFLIWINNFKIVNNLHKIMILRQNQQILIKNLKEQ